MPKFKTETETQTAATPDRTTQPRRRRAAKPARGATVAAAIASCPQLARIEQAARDAADAAFDLAHEAASSAPDRASIRRVRRAMLGRSRTAPEFEDLAVTADAFVRAFERHVAPLDPRMARHLVNELASMFRAPLFPSPVGVPVLRPAVMRTAPMRRPRVVHARRHPIDFGENFYGLA